MTRVTGISPTGENERGLMLIGRCNSFLPLGKVRMGLRTRGLMLIGRREHPITIVHRKAYRKKGSAPALANPAKSKPKIQ